MAAESINKKSQNIVRHLETIIDHFCLSFKFFILIIIIINVNTRFFFFFLYEINHCFLLRITMYQNKQSTFKQLFFLFQLSLKCRAPEVSQYVYQMYDAILKNWTSLSSFSLSTYSSLPPQPATTTSVAEDPALQCFLPLF